MRVEDVHNIAEKNRILWDNDPIFTMICRQVTGRDHLDSMNSSELEAVYREIITNPAIFSKSSADLSDDSYFKQNHDYDSGDFLDKIRTKLWEAY